MKVCFIVGTLARGGAERQLLFMLRALKSAGVSCRILCLTDGESYEAEIRRLNVPIDCVGRRKNRVVRLAAIIENLLRIPADIVQSSHFYTNIYVGLAGKFLKIPSVGAIRSDLDSEIKQHGLLGKWQTSLPRFLIVNSSLAHRRAIACGIPEEKIAFLRNAVETAIVNSSKSSDEPSRVKFLWVGRLDADKKPEEFIKLAVALNKLFPAYALEFLIAGDGVRRGELVESARKHNLPPDKLKFLGICANMSEIYNRADIFVSTSAREGTSNVILEAMSHGLPVIATNVGGTPEILNEKCGILIKPGSEYELITAAAKLLQHPGERSLLGNAAKKYVELNHSLENLKIELPSIYAKLLKSSLKQAVL